MVMNGFDTNFDRSNEVYAVNTVAFAYHDEPIKVKRGELVRIYVVNVLEFDFVNSFHIHANFFDYYPTGTKREPRDFTDTVILGQGERGIAEVRFPFTGKYMFHAHVSRVRGPGLDGLHRGGGLMEATTAPPRTRVPAWLAGLVPLIILGATIAAVRGARRARPGAQRRTGGGAVGGAHRAAAGRDRADRAQRRPRSGEIAQAVVNDGFAAFSQTTRGDRPARGEHGDGRSTRGSRGRPTRSR